MAVIASTIRGLQHGWTPTSDDAWIALRAHDVFSLHPPLVGTWSSASWFAHRNVNHPGPALFYALAVPVRILGAAVGTAVGVALINIVAIVLTAWLARRRGGDGFAVAVMVAVAVLLLTIGHELLFDPWNPFVALLPFLAFLFAVWSAVDGDGQALLIVAIAGAFVLQTHLSYVLLVPGLTVVAILGWARQLRREERGGLARTHPTRLQWSVAAFLAAALCWFPPLWQQLTGQPGNLTELWHASSAHQPKSVSGAGAVRMVADVLVRPPWWLPPSLLHPSFLHPGARTGGAPAVWAAVEISGLVVVLVALAIAMWRRSDGSAASGLIVALGATLLAIASVARASAPFGHLADYVIWLWAISLFVWVVLGWSVARALLPVVRARLEEHEPSAWKFAPVAAAVAALVAAVSIAAAVPSSASVGPSSPPEWMRTVKLLVRETVPRVRHDGPLVVLQDQSKPARWATPALELALTLHGIPWVTNDLITAHQVGMSRYVTQTRDSRLVVEQGIAAVRPPAGTTRVAYDARRSVAVLLVPQP